MKTQARSSHNLRIAVGCSLIWISTTCALAVGQSTTQPAGAKPVIIPDTPTEDLDELKGVGIEEHLNAGVPLDLEFKNEQGRSVQLKDYFDGERPVILTLVYFGCPKLCGLVSNAQLEAMKELADWTPGNEYSAVTISFDPRDTPTLAQLKKQNYVNAFGVPAAAGGWHFLTGRQDQIDKIAGAVGFKYKWDDRTEQFVHAAVIMIITPDGRISRYLYGVSYDPKVLRLSLVEASQGRIGSTMDHVLLYCFHYDPDQRGYKLAAQNIMTAGGAVTVLIMSAWLVPVWVRTSRKRVKLPQNV